VGFSAANLKVAEIVDNASELAKGLRKYKMDGEQRQQQHQQQELQLVQKQMRNMQELMQQQQQEEQRLLQLVQYQRQEEQDKQLLPLLRKHLQAGSHITTIGPMHNERTVSSLTD
jgi:hypothetical protein